MRDPQYVEGDPIALDMEIEEEVEDVWDTVDEAYDDWKESE